MALITCRDVTIGYDGKPAAEHISFEINEGDFIAVVGENGSGKSTLLKGILGLLPLTDGKITLNGISRRDIGYLPQQNSIQKDFPACVYEVVLSGFLNQKGLFSFYTKTDRQKADENLRLFGIYDLKRKSYSQLSGGQQQRVLLCRAFCATGKVLFLDEPITGLDAIAARELYSSLHSLCQQKIAVVMVTHEVEGALEKVNKILHMDLDTFFFGSVEDYQKSSFYHKLMGETK